MTNNIQHLIEPHVQDLGGFQARRLLPSDVLTLVGPFIFFISALRYFHPIEELMLDLIHILILQPSRIYLKAFCCIVIVLGVFKRFIQVQ
jgi:hypothetical protein